MKRLQTEWKYKTVKSGGAGDVLLKVNFAARCHCKSQCVSTLPTHLSVTLVHFVETGHFSSC